MDVVFTKTALKQLAGIDKKTAQRLVDRIYAYAENPSRFANQIKMLRGLDVFRLRIGHYRVIMTKAGYILTVLKVGHRREVCD